MADDNRRNCRKFLFRPVIDILIAAGQMLAAIACIFCTTFWESTSY